MIPEAGPVVGVVPARRGSKGISDKNLRPLGGRRLIEYTLDAAGSAASLTSVLVTSDDERVLELASARPGFMPLRRPDRLATDQAGMAPVVAHALEAWEAAFGETPAVVVLLQPTSPFRTGTDIDRAMDTFRSSGRASLISVCPATQHPAECVLLRDDHLELFLPEGATGRQAYPPCYFIDGSIYISTVERFRDRGSLFDGESAVHVLPPGRSLDVDEPFDLAMADAVLRYAREVDNSVFQLGENQIS